MAKDPEYIQPQFKWYGGWYKPTSVTDYVTVSAKGISNGLSGFPNDGAMFGPDTPLNNEFGSGNTTTSGIQEAINYVYTNNDNISKVKLVGTNYDITNAPFQQTQNGSDVAQILIPANSFSNSVINISIVGNHGRGGSEETTSYKSTGETLIQSLATTQSLTTNIIMSDGLTTSTPIANRSNVNLYIDGIHVRTSKTQTVTAINMYNIRSFSWGTLYIDTDSTDFTNINGGNGLYYNQPEVSVLGAGEQLTVMGYTNGLYAASVAHLYIGKYTSNYNTNGIYIDEQGYSGYIGLYVFQNTGVGIKVKSGIIAALDIGIIDVGDDIGTGTTALTYLVDALNGTRIHANLLFNSPAPTKLPFNISGSQIRLKANYVAAGSWFDLAISPNPPVSGIVYENNNPSDILIYLPAYATTALTAGKVVVAIGSSSTPSTTFTQFVSGSTSSSSPDTIQIKVPAGWYYEVTTTDVTLATATIVAD